MTTIAWDGSILAADTQGTLESGLPLYVHKIFRLTDGWLYAATGTGEDLLSVYACLNEQRDMGQLSWIAREDFSGLLVSPDGDAYRLGATGSRRLIEEPFMALGSGRDFALAAMLLGKNAIEAVMLAIQCDVFSGGPVEAMEPKSALWQVREAPREPWYAQASTGAYP